MNKTSKIRSGLVLLIIASLFCGVARAQVPVTDSQNVKSTVKNWMTSIKESKVVVGTMNTVKKTSAAIGTAKKAVSEYVLENKRKIEEKLKKVQEYKEKVEAYKKEYEEYKKQLDEGIAKAKELKEQAEEGIQTAKDLASTAKDAVSSVKDIAEAAKDKVSDKLGLPHDEGDSSSAPAVESSADVSAATASSPTPQNTTAQSAVTGAVSAGQASGTAPKVSSSRRAFSDTSAGTATVSDGGSAGGIISGGSSAGGKVSQAVMSEPVKMPMQIMNSKPVNASPAVSSVPERIAVDEVSSQLGKPVQADAAGQELAVEEQVSATTAVAGELSAVSPQISASKPVNAASAAIEIAPGSAQNSAALSPVKKEESLKASPPVNINRSAVAPSQNLAVPQKIKSLDQTVETPKIKTEELSVQPAAEKDLRKNLRRVFTTSSREGSARIGMKIPAAFAFALELPDDCSDVNNTRLFPRTTCMYCNLSSAKVKEEGVIDACLTDINKEIDTAQAYSGRDAPTAYRKGMLELAAVMIAESYRAANKAETFYDNKVAPIAEAPETLEQDALANLVEFNKAVDEQMNELMQLFSSKLALEAYTNYGRYRFKPEEDEDEE